MAAPAALALAGECGAWTLPLAAAPKRAYLQVGNGTLWTQGGAVNTVSVVVPSTALGSGAVQPMVSDSTQSRSPLDGSSACTPPQQVLVAASYQRMGNVANGPNVALLQVTSPRSLINANGDTIPFSQISWTVSSMAGDFSPGVIAPGTFSGGTQTLASVPANRFVQNCHTFSYANTAMRSAGTYRGTVVYTLTVP